MTPRWKNALAGWLAWYPSARKSVLLICGVAAIVLLVRLISRVQPTGFSVRVDEIRDQLEQMQRILKEVE